MKKSMKMVGALMGATALATSGMAYAALVVETEAVQQDAVVSGAEASETAGQEAEHVLGAFSFTQEALTSNAQISGVFNKAAAAMCATLSDYGIGCARQAVAVACGEVFFEATVSDMAAEEGSDQIVMGCACSSNVVGGGAVANAEVSGVSLASVAALAGAL